MKEPVCHRKTNTVCLDSMKFFCACIVAFVWHYQHFESATSPFRGIFVFSYPCGWLMVDLFFMLSGFGMMCGYSDKILNHRITFPQYMTKRLNKIYPLFFTTLILIVVLQLIFKAKMGYTFIYPNFDFYHLFLNLILCHDGLFGTDFSFNGPSWSISIFFILYSIFYLVFYFSKNTRSAVYTFAGLGIFGSVILHSGWNYPVLNGMVGSGLFCFSIGVILAYFYQNEQLLNTKLIGYLCLIVLIGLYMVYRTDASVLGNMQMLFTLLIAPMSILCTIFVPWLNKIMSMRIFTYLGSLSMEIYLFHFPVQCAIRNIDLYCNLELNYARGRIWILYAASTILVSILYKHLFTEKAKKLFTKALSHLILVFNKTV